MRVSAGDRCLAELEGHKNGDRGVCGCPGRCGSLTHAYAEGRPLSGRWSRQFSGEGEGVLMTMPRTKCMALGAEPVAPRWALPHSWGETGLQWSKGVTAPASPAQLLEERDSPFQET